MSADDTGVDDTGVDDTEVNDTEVNDTVVSTVALRVQLVGKTEFFPPAEVPWSTVADGGQALAEFAGRAGYQS